MKFNSTRCNSKAEKASYAIVSGISNDGGLYVPQGFYGFTAEDFDRMGEMDYCERAAFVMGKFLTDFSYDELKEIAVNAYSKFDSDEPAPITKLEDGKYVLELWHGPTCAFKDMALTVLPYLMTSSKEKQNLKEDIKILVATSGDTGKAALEGFKDVEGTSIIVFYPSDGVSDIQKKQMTTQLGNNVYVAAIKGNFDDCQTGVKKIFAGKDIESELLKRNIKLSSANSINFGRLVPQIVYYVSTYVDLLDSGEIAQDEAINFCVPTGNFGNILAGYYAKQMGVKINKLICASNSNKILTDFFAVGEYDTKREFFKTISPSMDILVSSNLERLIYELSGRDDKLTAKRMDELKASGKYSVSKEELKKYSAEFYAENATDEETMEEIDRVFEEYGYAMDPHTAVASSVYEKYADRTGDKTKTVIVSTASPYKFAQDVLYALTGDEEEDAFKAIKLLYEETAMEIPANIATLKKAAVRFKDIYDIDDLKDVVLSK